MKNLGQFLQDSNHEFSATRLAFLAWIFGALIIWGNGSVQEQQMQKVPESVIALIGILMTGKVAQKVSEGSGFSTPGNQPAIENGKPVSPFPSGNNAALASSKTN